MDNNPKLANVLLNRSHLDVLADRFADEKDNNVFSEFMKELEKSVVLVPAEAPANVTDEMKQAMKDHKPIPVDMNNQPKVYLLPKNDGTRVMPVFTSAAQIPADKRPPVIMNMPFRAVIGVLKANSDQVSQIAVNPFTKGFILNENLIDLVDRRYKAGADKAEAQGTNVRITEQQLHSIAHVKMAREWLPAKVFEDPESVLADIKLQKEKYIINAYRQVYPANIRPPYAEDDIAVMSLQVEDDLMITRIDLPEKYTQEGSPLRIYITEHNSETGYYMIEKGGKDISGMIACVRKDGTHEKLSEAPDNGAEIEAIMGLIRPS